MVSRQHTEFFHFSLDARGERTVRTFGGERRIELAVSEVGGDEAKNGADENVMPVVYINAC